MRRQVNKLLRTGTLKFISTEKKNRRVKPVYAGMAIRGH